MRIIKSVSQTICTTCQVIDDTVQIVGTLSAVGNLYANELLLDAEMEVEINRRERESRLAELAA